MKWRTEYEYEIDGVIVTDDKVHKRINKNPEHAFAFKMVISDQVAETHVLDVIWTASKDGYLKPRVRIDPVRIGGVTIEYATGFNGQFIESNKIGVGAVIQLVRSGDVIPYIKSVTTPASIAKMPSVPYSWNSTHVDVLLTNKDDDPVVLEKQITAFFTTLEVVGLSTGNVRRLIQSGYNNVPKIVHMTLGDFQKVEGFQEKLSQKVHTSIHEKIRSSSLARLLAACGCLGRGLGERKLKPILESYPTIFTSTETPSEKLRMLMGINGIGKENAKSFIEHMAKCTTFLNACGLGDRLSTVDNGSSSTSSSEKESNSKMPKQKQNQNQNSEHPLFNKKIVFTGFREKELMKKMEDGYKVSFGSSVSKNIFMLVVKELTTKNAKVEQARKLEIPIMNFRDFREKYFGSSSS
jgi:NAD-dependent DNA ligase